jgi:ketosteroid isomerase-like protein
MLSKLSFIARVHLEILGESTVSWAADRRGANMSISNELYRMRGLFVLALATGCLWGASSYAGTDEDAVKAALAGYHAALNTKDPAKLEAFWAHDDGVTDVEPTTKSIAVGWDAVKKNIEGYFPVFTELKVEQADGPHIQIKGDMASSVGIAKAAAKMKDGNTFTGTVFESDVFEKRDGAWLLVSHVASRVPE